MKTHKNGIQRPVGATLVEFIVLSPIILSIGLGIAQWALVSEAKAAPNHTASMAPANSPGNTTGTCLPPDDEEEGDNGGPGVCEEPSSPGSQDLGMSGSMVGNPISVITGNKYQREQDIGPLPGELAVDFSRRYNSLSQHRGVLGHGWRHDYETRLRVEGDALIIEQGDGRRAYFEGQGTRRLGRIASDGEVIAVDAGFDWHLPDGRTLQFDTDGRLHSIRRPGGARLRLLYDRGGAKLLAVSDHQGRRLDLAYYPNGRLQRVTGPGDGHIDYTYDSAGNLEYVRHADGSTRRYHYEEPRHPHHLTGITDERGERYASYAYDAQGRAILSTHADGVGQVTLDYQADRTRVTDSQGRSSTYHTEVRHGIPLVTAIDGPGCSACGGGDVRYSYNGRFQLSAITSGDGTRVERHYDAQGRLIEVSEGAGGEQRWLTRYTYTGDERRPSGVRRPSVNPEGEHQIAVEYDTAQRPVTITERGYSPEGEDHYTAIERTVRLAYDSAGQLSAIDGPRESVDDTIRLAHDDRRRLRTLSTPDGRTLTVSDYDPHGRPVQLRWDDEPPLSVAYNGRGQITRIEQGGHAIVYAYDAAGHLSALTGPDGRRLTVDYDAAGRATTLEAPGGRRIDFDIDSEGRLTQRRISDSNGQLLATVGYLWDAQGRLSAIETPAGRTRYSHDAKGRLTGVEAPDGARTDFSYDALGQLLAIAQPGAGITRLHYDAAGQTIGITDPRSNTSDLIKDDFGQLVLQRSPDSGETRHRYDTAGNRIATTDPDGHTTRWRYDAANRPLEETTAEGTTRFQYEKGRLAEITGPEGIEQFAYDAQGRLTAHTRILDGHTFTTGYRYDSAGTLIEKRLPDGQTLVYHHDTEGPQKGRLRAVTRKTLLGLRQSPLISEIDQDPEDGTTGHRHGNGLQLTRRHDPLGRLSALEHSRQPRLEYRYDAHGQISGIDLDGTLQHYRYDRAGRLIGADTRLGSYRYTYDTVGNRTERQHSPPGASPAASATPTPSRARATGCWRSKTAAPNATPTTRPAAPPRSAHCTTTTPVRSAPATSTASMRPASASRSRITPTTTSASASKRSSTPKAATPKSPTTSTTATT